jgi:NADH-quinone oxidoreductase subunit M
MKRLVAYSSVSHLGFVMLGLMALSSEALTGSVYQMLNHGISTGALFLLVGLLYERRHTRQIAEYGGLGKRTPVIAAVFLVVTLSSIGLPGTNGFVGEFLILSGTWLSRLHAPALLAALAAVGVILGAVYMLLLVERVFLGPIRKDENRSLRDMSVREGFVLAPMVVLIVVMGLLPQPFLRPVKPAVDRLVERFQAAEARLGTPPQVGTVPAATSQPAVPAQARSTGASGELAGADAPHAQRWGAEGSPMEKEGR